jgi:hypothetical protein
LPQTTPAKKPARRKAAERKAEEARAAEAAKQGVIPAARVYLGEGDYNNPSPEFLEFERAKLTQPQRQELTEFCADMKKAGIYTPKAELSAALLIRTDDNRAETNSLLETLFENETARVRQEAKFATTEAAPREPLPKSVAQFDAHLDPKAKTERDATTRAEAAAKTINQGAYQSRREDFTRYDGLTAHHAANTPARIPAASHAFGALDLQSRQPPQPQPEREKSHSPFASLPFAEKQYVAIRDAQGTTRPTQKAPSEPNNTMRAFAPLTPAQLVACNNAPAERKYLAVRDVQEGRSEGMSGDSKRFLAVREAGGPQDNARPNGNGRGGLGR